MPSYSKNKQTGNRKITVDEYKKKYDKEVKLQRDCEQWLDQHGIQYLRIPEEVTGLCSPTHPARVSQHIKNMISKHFKGWPDLMIFNPANETNYNTCLLVELKSKKGAMTQGQKNLARKLNVLEIRSLEDFIANAERFLNAI